MAYLDYDGLLYFWQKLKAKLAGKVDKVDGKQLSTNDYTTAEKNKLAGLNNYTHPTYTSKTSGLYKITVDGTGHVSAATAVAKADITALGIPSTNTTYSDATQATHGLMSVNDKKKLDAFSSAGNYALKTDITAMYRYRGSVESVDKLPTTGQTVGDVYDVGDGMNYAWNGEKWDGLGQVFTIEKIKNTEIDTVLAS